MDAQLVLYLPDEDGITLADRLIQVEKTIGERNPLMDSVHVPDDGYGLWNTFWQINNNCSDSITFNDILSYCTLYETEFTVWEIDTIISLSSHLQSYIRKEQQKKAAQRKNKA